jgi:hypothetical protein
MGYNIDMKTLMIVSGLTIAFAWVGFTNNQMEELMAIDYCWDSNGEHYVVPDERCGADYVNEVDGVLYYQDGTPVRNYEQLSR